jgi:hypothetical protein
MSRISTRPSQTTQDPRFRRDSSFAVVALLLLPLVALPLAAQTSSGGTTPGSPAPPVKAPFVEGFVSAFDGTIVTLLGSPLLRIDVSGATLLAADATGVTPPLITPGAHIWATVEPLAPPNASPLPPPLIATAVAVRPAGTAVLSGEILSVGSDSFALLFRTILVDENTVFSGYGSGGPVQGLSDLNPGMQATAWVVVSSGALLAKKVEAYGPFVVPPPLSFRSVVKVIGSDSWTIGDYTVGVTADTKIVGDPQVGDTADVVAIVEGPPNPMMGMPSRLVAISIVKVILPPSPVAVRTISLTGPVQAMPSSGMPGVWRIADRSVTVTALTTIEGNPAVGSAVAVTGYALPSLLAGNAAATPAAMAFIATHIRTVP